MLELLNWTFASWGNMLKLGVFTYLIVVPVIFCIGVAINMALEFVVKIIHVHRVEVKETKKDATS